MWAAHSSWRSGNKPMADAVWPPAASTSCPVHPDATAAPPPTPGGIRLQPFQASKGGWRHTTLLAPSMLQMPDGDCQGLQFPRMTSYQAVILYSAPALSTSSQDGVQKSATPQPYRVSHSGKSPVRYKLCSSRDPCPIQGSVTKQDFPLVVDFYRDMCIHISSFYFHDVVSFIMVRTSNYLQIKI